jgi:hypothetical protein
MADKSDIKTGRILKIDPQLKAGYIVSDSDGAFVLFSMNDVVKEVGVGYASEDQMVQFIQEQDASGTVVAKQVTVLPMRRAR